MLNYKSNEEEIIYKNFYSKINRIIDMGKSMMSSLVIEDIIVAIKDEVLKLNNSDAVGIGLFNKKNDDLEYRLYTKGKIEEHKIIYLKDNNDFLFHYFNKKEEAFINCLEDSDYTRFNLLTNSDYRIESLICIPLLIKNNEIGIITIQSYKKNNYTIEDLNELKIISGFAAIALENGNLFNKVKYCAEHDDLTGLLKRNKILDEGQKFSELIINDDDIYSLIMIDIDYFKRVNDQYGHNIGDVVLKDVSEIIKSSVRKNDFVGRYGGEEFLIILPDTDTEFSMKIAERIRKAVEKYKFEIHESQYINVTISLGIYQLNFTNSNFINGLKKSDKALYEAKNSGRNRSIIYEEKI